MGMFVSSIKKAQKAMFPIFRTDQIDATHMRVNVVGTGFFIGADGLFVSVAHVFDGATDTTKFLYPGKLPEEVSNPFIQIEEIARDDSNDIFIGRVSLSTPNFLKLAKGMPDVGRTVCIAGYPLAVIAFNAQGVLEVGGVRRYFQPTYVLDQAICKVDNGQGVLRSHNGFSVRDVGLFGMSGGPVFDIEGSVLGIQGSVTDPRVSTAGNGRTIVVENAVAIKTDLVLDLVQREAIVLVKPKRKTAAKKSIAKKKAK